MHTRKILLFLVCIMVLSCTKDQMPLAVEFDAQLKEYLNLSSETGDYRNYILPSENDLENIPQDPKNPLTEDKVELGKLLFYETAFAMDARYLSGLQTYSCATCHVPEAGFRPGRSQGIADGGLGYGVIGENRVRNTEYGEAEMDVQGARPLSMLNVAFVTNTFWNGQFGSTAVNEGTEAVWGIGDPSTVNNLLGFHGIESQNFEGMIVHRFIISEHLVNEFGYKEYFDKAFPEVNESDRYNNITGSLALSAYIRTILATKAPFQRWLKGEENAMTLDEKKGGILFFGKARCNSCHYRPNLGSLEFQAIGANDLHQIPSFNTTETDRRNLGRGGFTLKEEDYYKFKVPQLYNLADDPFFFHGSSKRSIDEVIEYKMNAIAENPNVTEEYMSPKFNAVNLTEEEQAQLKAFLENALRDPDLLRYKPDHTPSGYCFPNNDQQSAIDIGCN